MDQTRRFQRLAFDGCNCPRQIGGIRLTPGYGMKQQLNNCCSCEGNPRPFCAFDSCDLMIVIRRRSCTSSILARSGEQDCTSNELARTICQSAIVRRGTTDQQGIDVSVNRSELQFG